MNIADELLSASFVDHDPVQGQTQRMEGYKQMVGAFRSAFPDLRVRNEDVIEEGNKVVGPFGGLMLALLLFALQIVFSRWWLQHFRFGPFEWLWRSATYWKRQPMRKKQ